MDLTQVEGLNDLINAETDDQHMLALNMYRGELKELFCKWTDVIVKVPFYYLIHLFYVYLYNNQGSEP